MRLSHTALSLACSALMLCACGGGDGDGGSSLSVQSASATAAATSTSSNTTVQASTAAAAAAVTVCGANSTSPLAGVRTWMYQLQDLLTDAQINALDAQPYDMVVVEAGNTVKTQEKFNTAGMVTRLRTKADGSPRKVIAYIDIGQAESFRTYWIDNQWKTPTATKPGVPDFILTVDPDGWADDYPVAYWDQRWQDLWLGTNGAVAQLAREGFDGVYLDWVEGYTNAKVVAAAKKAGVNPAKAMVDFIARIRAAGRAINPQFAVIQQNAPELIDAVGASKLLPNLDAIAQEDTWFGGDAGASWGDASGTDQGTSSDDTQWTIEQLQKHCAGGLPVFTIDYALTAPNPKTVYTTSRSLGFRPLVSRVALSKPTTTPPWNY
ncbi:endo alpha-1,4 polygalactosaminidase [Ralstonia solanacearum]|uniref:Endo alpha-1,4 polygalactosaminidase n=1 Tax=Ralstonia solanacearum TaxID=305 RepID=A0AAW5ZU72_RALSL|nr:endo alpha-1,4 polygalactosaminidase [Ralstonia solanacearum]AYB51045.2 endo alpha-1,4 polygalactosaminidase [Ralstonia solanacearum]AYB55597.2 endo alpha-1,4 polygalactosaminidase [Ralstonia solanacearum]MDB0564617.1 endo alpha-1,4 polygalactosaminidase [Ralstonia solanacearum]MDB0572775.1 endo alpha-1,4 polygalactosaminidase [Ralstonia solanacearum]MDB0577119.1 endo alpha-1,4 polygalactosaminidase [Ralstonia solanacearum]